MPTPLPVIDQTYRVAIEWQTTSGLTAVNVMHIHTDAANVAAIDVAAVVDAHTTNAMWATLGSAWSSPRFGITPLDGVSATSHFGHVTPAHWTGGTGGDVVPAVASVLKIQTGIRGRSFRGRLYLPSPAESQMAGGKITDGTEVSATAAWTTFKNALIADATTPCQMGVATYDRRHFGAGAQFTQAHDLLVEQTLATQRRRQSRLR